MLSKPNRAAEMLRAARAGQYGIPAVCVYNIEGIMATVRAATAQQSPAMILLFPWAQSYSQGGGLAQAAGQAAEDAPVPITVHLDHAQTPEAIRAAADMTRLDRAGKVVPCFDSIMVDMSHYEHAENLRLTAELTEYCHARGIAVEAESGRIEGGEDGVSDTAELAGLMTSPAEAKEFADTGIDWLAPAFGNVHGLYGPRGVQLEFDRLQNIRQAIGPDVQLILHGTDTFTREIYRQCVEAGVTKCNINRNVNEKMAEVWRATAGKKDVGVTKVMEEGTDAMQKEIEVMIDWLGCAGRA